MTNHPDQLGFDALLENAAAENATHLFEKETAHLPETMVAAIPFHAAQIKLHHVAMLEGDFDAAIAIREEAHLLASKLNGGRHGIIADENAPGCVLARACRAKPDAPPLWGQEAEFVITLKSTPIAVTLRGMFGIGGCFMPYAGFSVRAMDLTKPFLSKTGYRSFLGVSVPHEMGMTPGIFVRRVLETHLDHELCGNLVPIATD